MAIVELRRTISSSITEKCDRVFCDLGAKRLTIVTIVGSIVILNFEF